MHSSVHWSVIYNSQDTEATKGLINRSKDKEDRVHIYWNIVKVKVLVTQSCPTLCDPMDYSPPGSSVHGILWARTLEWVAISFRDLPNPGMKPGSPSLPVDSLPSKPPGKPVLENYPAIKDEIKWNTAICDNIDESTEYYANWNKWDKDKYCMISLIHGI